MNRWDLGAAAAVLVVGTTTWSDSSSFASLLLDLLMTAMLVVSVEYFFGFFGGGKQNLPWKWYALMTGIIACIAAREMQGTEVNLGRAYSFAALAVGLFACSIFEIMKAKRGVTR